MDLQGLREFAKPIVWWGTALKELKMLPDAVRARAGRELRKVQFGVDPDDAKPVKEWGAGVFEIRLDDEVNTWRVACVAKFEEAVYVLHSFNKKDRRTRHGDAEIVKARYRDVINERRRDR